MAKSKYNRILLKLSGESFCEPGGFGIEGDRLGSIAERIFSISKLGYEIAIVVGAVRRWDWVRHPVFRLSHVAAIVVVAANGMETPRLLLMSRSDRYPMGLAFNGRGSIARRSPAQSHYTAAGRS